MSLFIQGIIIIHIVSIILTHIYWAQRDLNFTNTWVQLKVLFLFAKNFKNTLIILSVVLKDKETANVHFQLNNDLAEQ